MCVKDTKNKYKEASESKASFQSSRTMAANGMNSSPQPLLTIFKEVSCHFWSLKMKNLFKSQELWELVETGFIDPEPDEPNQ